MARWRIAVAVVVPRPLADRLDVLRAGLGAPDPDRVAPHLTLVPPVNVRDDDLPAALARLRAAAADVDPFDVVLGPVASFEPVTPTIHLAVREVGGTGEGAGKPAGKGAGKEAATAAGGQRSAESTSIPGTGPPGQQRLAALQRAVARAPLQREVDHPFVAHVTLVEQAPLHRIHAARLALAACRFTFTVARLSLLRERRDDEGRRRWRPVADVDLDGVRIVGRGGLPLELAAGTLLDPEAATALGLPPPPAGLVVTAHREGEVVGAAWGPRPGDRRAVDEPVADLLSGEWAFRADQRRARGNGPGSETATAPALSR